MRTPYVPHVTNDVDDEYKFYYGLAESSYKERFRNHTNLFNHRRYQNETELSKNIWTLKHQNKTPMIKCKTVQVVNGKVKLNSSTHFGIHHYLINVLSLYITVDINIVAFEIYEGQ